jgi:hypothetical protein
LAINIEAKPSTGMIISQEHEEFSATQSALKSHAFRILSHNIKSGK